MLFTHMLNILQKIPLKYLHAWRQNQVRYGKVLVRDQSRNEQLSEAAYYGKHVPVLLICHYL